MKPKYKYGKLMFISATMLLMLQGCSGKELKDTPNTIGNKTYSYEEVKELGNNEYEASNLNEYLLSESLLAVADADDKKKADKYSEKYFKENDITDKDVKDNYSKQTLSNIVLQKEYDKQLAKEKGYTENLNKELKRKHYTTVALQIVVNDSKELDKITKEINKEFKGKMTDQDYVDFVMMYGVENSYEGKKKINKNLKDKIVTDIVSLNLFSGGEIFPEILVAKDHSINKIGKGDFVGFMIPVKKVKMSKEEIKESYRQSKLLGADFLQTKNMLLTIDKESDKVDFSEKVIDSIEKNWKTTDEDEKEK